MALHIDQIRTDGGTQSRAAINEATVAEYAEAMADENTVFPPVVVYFDGRNHWLADGFHRLEAWRRVGRTEIPAEVRQGDRRRAILHSVAANSAHGLRRSNEDKRRAVLTLLEDDEWRQWSNREIARRCAVSESFVRAVRDGLSAHETQIEQVRTVERGGTVYTQRVASIGKATQAQADMGIPTSGHDAPDQSNVDQQTESPQPIAIDRQSSRNGAAGNQSQAADQEASADVGIPMSPPAADPDAAERRKLGKLTTEALIEEVLGLKAALADERAKRKAAEIERDRLKAQVAEFTQEERGRALGIAQRRAREFEGRMKEYQAKAARAERAAEMARAERDKIRAQLEAQEISFGGAA